MMNIMRAFFRQIITTSAPSSVSNEKPPQLVAFEAKLTRMMKTVPGINEDQVKEIVEYLSSEDTWSDSYDSSDYTSSDIDLEVYGINVNNIKDEDLIEQENLQRETALMYSKLMAKMHENESEVEQPTTPTASSSDRRSSKVPPSRRYKPPELSKSVEVLDKETSDSLKTASKKNLDNRSQSELD